LLSSLDPSVGVRATRSWAMGDRLARQRSIELDLRNVGSLRLPLRRAGRHRREHFTVTVASDGPVALGLRQLERGRRVRVDGKPAGRAGRGGRLTVRLAAGEHSIAL
jgi:hypothetical protein